MLSPLFRFSLILFIALGWITSVAGQSYKTGMVADWTFHPNYTLARNAANYPGNKIDPPKSRFERFKTLGEPLQFYGQLPTERICDVLAPSTLPNEAFSIDLWLLNHVNQPVGTLITAKGKAADDEPVWLLGYFGDEVVFHLRMNDGTVQTLSAKINKGWKKYWGHLVGTYDGQKMALFLNGKELATSDQLNGQLEYPENAQIEFAGYFHEERYMQISNLLKAARLHNRALQRNEIVLRFEVLKQMVEAGVLFPETFHFNAGPYLHLAQPNSINLLWETNQLSTATVKWGPKLPLSEKKTLTTPAYIQETTIENLEPGTLYYYEVIAYTADGKEMSSGILTFGTAPETAQPFTFCIIGDTESRPHINHRLGEMIWEERPNFILHLGDITDGGKQPHKFEWNYEYFQGITPVCSRIPMFPVPGNGEGDLYWYKRYHRLPEPEAYYSFKYGNAEFFMLNSNAKAELKEGGVQYEWLKDALADSDATWKFVAHHHCPVSSDENDFGDTWKGEASTQGDPRFDDLKALYEAAGVDIVFYGHVHAYERSYPLKEGQVDTENGVIYIMSGGAGGHLEDFVPTNNWFSNKIQRGNHYCRVSIFDGTFSFKMYDLEGRLKDFVELKK